MRKLTGVFIIREYDNEVWKSIVDGVLVKADFNSKGAAAAAIPVERRRRRRAHALKPEYGFCEACGGPINKPQQWTLTRHLARVHSMRDDCVEFTRSGKRRKKF